jgi:ribose-phosphate pyrophosphokinase
MLLFALNASSKLGLAIADRLGCSLAAHEEREFANGEHKARPLTDVWNEDVAIVSSLHGDAELSVNDKICRLLFFVGALKDAGARRVTAVLPYLAYSRKDRRTKPRDPVIVRYLATALQSVGADGIMTIDVHNAAALENAFRGPVMNLGTARLFADHFHRSSAGEIDTIVSPDLGGIKSTRLLLDAWADIAKCTVKFAVLDKTRSEGKVGGAGLLGNVGEYVLIVDDMIGSGTTLCRAVAACREAGASRVAIGATHGLFEGGAPALFRQEEIGEIVVTDSIAIGRLGLDAANLVRIRSLSVAGLFAECLHELDAGAQ